MIFSLIQEVLQNRNYENKVTVVAMSKLALDFSLIVQGGNGPQVRVYLSHEQAKNLANAILENLP